MTKKNQNISKAEKLARAMDSIMSGHKGFNRQIAAQVRDELRRMDRLTQPTVIGWDLSDSESTATVALMQGNTITGVLHGAEAVEWVNAVRKADARGIAGHPTETEQANG